MLGNGHNRTELQKIAEGKLEDACLLLQHHRYSNSYYLAGYAVEIGLKACIAAQVTRETVPGKTFLQKFFSHDFDALIGLAGLASEKKRQLKSPNFQANWAIVSEWTPDTRYEAMDVTSAQTMIQAITIPEFGVMQWIKQHW